MSEEEKNKTHLRRIVEEAFNKGDLKVLDALISPKYPPNILPLGFNQGPEGYRGSLASFRRSFPDLHYQIDDMIAEGDKVSARYTFTGTHIGYWMDIAPTNKAIKMPLAYFYHFENGKVLEEIVFIDWATFYSQLGVSPPAPQG